MFTRIVVPVDGSELAEQALVPAEELARITSLPLHLIRVVDIVPSATGAMSGFSYSETLFTEMLQSDEAAADEYLAMLTNRYANTGIAVTVERRTGPVATELLAAARDGDLFVMASHGRGGVARWFLGSIAEELTRHSRVPIMVVRAQPE